MSKVCLHSIWKCIDNDDEMYERYCIVKSIDDDPDYNGEGTIELLYANNIRSYGKVRRFMPGITHRFIKMYEGRRD